jgi:NitT/TauT family transport system substrate-binding protein
MNSNLAFMRFWRDGVGLPRSIRGLRGQLALAACLFAGSASEAFSQNATSPVPLKFTLDWIYTGAAGLVVLALEGGHFAAQGLAVEMSTGRGAADAVRRVATGQADVGIADVGAIIAHNAANPTQLVTAFYMIYEKSPLAVVSLAEANIRAPNDLQGKRIAAPIDDAGRLMFPAFGAASGIDASTVTWLDVEPALRESKLIVGDVAAITGFSNASPALLFQGVAAERIRVMPYSDFGLDLYGLAVFGRSEFLQRSPGTVRAIAAAVNAGIREALERPALAVAALKKRGGPRVNVELEAIRVQLTNDQLIRTPTTLREGPSHVDPMRLERQIVTVQAALKLPTKPSVQSVYTAAYLPDANSRKIR